MEVPKLNAIFIALRQAALKALKLGNNQCLISDLSDPLLGLISDLEIKDISLIRLIVFDDKHDIITPITPPGIDNSKTYYTISFGGPIFGLVPNMLDKVCDKGPLKFLPCSGSIYTHNGLKGDTSIVLTFY